ncbi:MAG: hypothetical protein IT211_07810 [Armatimonadetes bacterium]|nr:hypothetical protein [Armatimonadota bacterium]
MTFHTAISDNKGGLVNVLGKQATNTWQAMPAATVATWNQLGIYRTEGALAKLSFGYARRLYEAVTHATA